MMSLFDIFQADTKPDLGDMVDPKNQRDLYTQMVIAGVFGLSAFLTFCILRPKWTELYAARKRQKDEASRLPELPGSLFGWIPVLYRISETEVLASAGLDAFAFLAFFRFAIKFLAATLFFALVVILPVQYVFTGKTGAPGEHGIEGVLESDLTKRLLVGAMEGSEKEKQKTDAPFLWMYVVFVYIFSGLAVYFLVIETNKIIRIRQNYLGSQSTATDRTIRLSGIPPELRSEEKIKEFIENLEIGNVDSVMLCRNWTQLDKLMTERMNALRRLEEAWTVHLGFRRVERNNASLPFIQPPPPGPDGDNDDSGEQTQLLASDEAGQAHVSPYARDRPTTRIWHGFFNMQSKKIDAIDYYEEKLRKLDDKIRHMRKEEYSPTPLAFVTMESVAASQMAVQAILDPAPMRLLASLAPAPADVVWQNTYLSRSNRMFRSWSITLVIGILTVFWGALLIPLATLLNVDAIRKVLPSLANALDEHKTAKSLVETTLPTLLFSLLTVAVPYIYDWLSNLQGMTSQGDVELSTISKNFFFTFFNLFLIFTVFSAASNFVTLWDNIKDALKDTTMVAYALARSLERVAPFYTNLIVLQALGLFPFRLLEFGAIALYPVFLIGAKTPRDYAELVQPPVFSYGFYLPQTLLIFIVCVVYSILPGSWLVLAFGLFYFAIGGFIYKYQLLYAMDHRQHSTGRAWPMICSRIMVGLVVFQVAMVGILALRTAWTKSVLLVPVVAATVWFSIYFRKTYEPLMKFIALRSIKRDGQTEGSMPPESRWDIATDHGRTVDEHPETGLRYINPNLVTPLEEKWIGNRRGANGTNGGHQADSEIDV